MFERWHRITRVQGPEDIFGVVRTNLRAVLNMGFGLRANDVRAERYKTDDYCTYAFFQAMHPVVCSVINGNV